MSEQSALESLLRRDRAITLLGLLLLCVLAWAYTVSGAGLGMSAWQMTTFSLFPHTEMVPAMTAPDAMSDMNMPGMAMPDMAAAPQAWTLATMFLVVAMWWVMMIAMMAPSAAPTILLYARVFRHAAAQGPLSSRMAPTGAFTAGYLLVWLGFSLAAATLQWLLMQAGLVSEVMMGSQSRWLSGGLLIAVGLYQLSPLKRLCLERCRSPTEFLTQNWRPGAIGAARLGVMHGAYCVGCCWALMALLFVGGIMNLAWIAALGVLVLVEKSVPWGRSIGSGVGALLMLWGGVTFFV